MTTYIFILSTLFCTACPIYYGAIIPYSALTRKNAVYSEIQEKQEPPVTLRKIKEPSELDKLTAKLLEQKRFDDVMMLLIPYVNAGHADIQYSLGVIVGAEGAQITNMTKKEQQLNAFSWIKMSALQGYPKAVQLVADTYEMGWYYQPVNHNLATCWQAVKGQRKHPSNCD